MRVRVAIIAVSVAVFGFGYLELRALEPEREVGILATDPPTPYIHLGPVGPQLGSILLIHGLDASKELMQAAGMAMADGGFEVYVVDLPGHGSSAARFSIWACMSVVDQILKMLGPDTIPVGHSMGGGILAEMAASRQFDTMVLYSPEPMPVDRIHAGRLLVVSGGREAPAIERNILRVVGGAQGRAVWWRYPEAGHSTALFAPSKLKAVVRWLGGRDEDLLAAPRFGWLALMAFAGVCGFITVWGPARGPARALSAGDGSAPGIVAEYVAAAGVAAVLLRFVNPLGWMNLFATDYMMGVVLIAGLLLWRGRGVSLSGRGVAAGLLGAVGVIGVFGLGIGARLVHIVPSGTDWWRIPVFTLAAMPLLLRDEETLRRIRPPVKAWTTFLATRAVLWATVVTGVQLWNREAAFLVLIMHIVVVFWIGLWAISGAVARRTEEPGAAALFAALIQGWTFAAMFVSI